MVKPVLVTKGLKRLEPDDGKLSSPVLRGRRKWQRFLCYPTLVIAFCMSIFAPYNNLDAAEILSTEELRQLEANVREEPEKFKQIAQEVEVEVKSKDPVITEETQDKSKLVADILNNYNQIKESSCENSDREGFRIFVSFSMLKGLLRDLDQVARRISARLVIRGLKDNSFKRDYRLFKNRQGQHYNRY